jgi:hypothetical protein
VAMGAVSGAVCHLCSMAWEFHSQADIRKYAKAHWWLIGFYKITT